MARTQLGGNRLVSRSGDFHSTRSHHRVSRRDERRAVLARTNNPGVRSRRARAINLFDEQHGGARRAPAGVDSHALQIGPQPLSQSAAKSRPTPRHGHGVLVGPIVICFH